LSAILTWTFDNKVSFISGDAWCNWSNNKYVCNLNTINSGANNNIHITLKVWNNSNRILNHTILNFSSDISTTSIETNYLDNHSQDGTPILQAGMSYIQWKVYIDKDKDHIFSSGTDLNISWTKIFAVGKDIYGKLYWPNPTTDPWVYNLLITSAGLTGTSYQIINPSTTSYNGEFTLWPVQIGNYKLYIQTPAWYTWYTSKWWRSMSDNTPLWSWSYDSVNISSLYISWIIIWESEQSVDNQFGIVWICGNSSTQLDEQCDGQPWCSNSCTFKQPSCTIAADPSSMIFHTPITFTISWVDTWRVQIGQLDFRTEQF